MSAVAVPHLFTAPTSSGPQNITAAALGDLTPKAAYFFFSKAQTLGTARAQAHMGFGATDDTRQWACACHSEDGQTETDDFRRAMKDMCIVFLDDAAATVEAEASFVSFIDGGIQINWATGASAAYQVGVLFLAGTDLSVRADTVALSTQDVAVAVTDVGFTLQGMLLATYGEPFNDLVDTAALLSQGCVSWDGTTLKQTCWAFSEDPTGVDGNPFMYWSNTRASAQRSGTQWRAEVSDVDSAGFDITPRNGAAGGDEVGYLAFTFNNVIKIYADSFTGPTATGTFPVTDAGFRPQCVFMAPTWHDGLTDTDQSDLKAGSFGAAAFDDGNSEMCLSMQVEDAATITNTQSFANSRALHLPEDDGTAGNEADFSLMLSTGFELNYTAVNASGQSSNIPYMAFGARTRVPFRI